MDTLINIISAFFYWFGLAASIAFAVIMIFVILGVFDFVWCYFSDWFKGREDYHDDE